MLLYCDLKFWKNQRNEKPTKYVIKKQNKEMMNIIISVSVVSTNGTLMSVGRDLGVCLY